MRKKILTTSTVTREPGTGIGISGDMTYAFNHETFGVGIHAHYYRTFNEYSRWSWGLMGEYALT